MNRSEYVMAVVIASCRRNEAEIADDRTPDATISRLRASIDHTEVFTEASLDEVMSAYDVLSRMYPDCGYSTRGAQSMWTLYASEPDAVTSIIDGRRRSIARVEAGLRP